MNARAPGVAAGLFVLALFAIGVAGDAARPTPPAAQGECK